MIARFRELLGDDAVATGDAACGFAVDGVIPQCVLLPSSVDTLAQCAAVADAAGLAVIPAGNGTQLDVGRVPERYDIALSTQRLRRVLAHEAADMTVTVEAGVTLSDLNALLNAGGQRLPLDPPHPEQTTIGAMIATDASGPLRLANGKVRDLLIGITVVLADGTLVKGGGRVVKNVAGYDLMKLFTGSFGSLGIVVQATFKVRPLPQCEAAFVIAVSNTAAAVQLALDVLAAPLAPQSVEVLNGVAARSIDATMAGPVVVIGCGGLPEERAVQHERLSALAGAATVRAFDEAAFTQLNAAVRDLPARGCGCKVSVLPSKMSNLLQRLEEEATRRALPVAVLAHVGSGVVFARFDAVVAANGALPPFAEWLRECVYQEGGYVVFDALPTLLKARIDPWGAEPPSIALMRGIKQTLDPRRRLSPGRFVGGI